MLSQGPPHRHLGQGGGVEGPRAFWTIPAWPDPYKWLHFSRGPVFFRAMDVKDPVVPRMITPLDSRFASGRSPLHTWGERGVACYTPADTGGPLAQLAEQLTLNQPVEGSSPSRLTNATVPYAGAISTAPAPLSGEVSELADEHDLGSCAERRRSSSLLFPTTRTGHQKHILGSRTAQAVR